MVYVSKEFPHMTNQQGVGGVSQQSKMLEEENRRLERESKERAVVPFTEKGKK